MATKIASTETFDDLVLRADKPVLVDFWAEWCGPCRALAPILDQIAEEHGDKIKIVKVNVDDNPELGSRYRVTSLPMMKVIVQGEVAKTIPGVKPKHVLEFELADFIQ
jgi:thioredoxin 1